MNSMMRRMAGGAVVLMVAGCVDPGPDMSRPAVLEPAGLGLGQAGQGLSVAAWPSLAWWQAYNDPQLDRLIADAVAASPTLAQARARADRAAALAGQAKAALSPTLDASGTVTQQRFSENGAYPQGVAGKVRSQDEIGVAGGWDLDLWGGNRAAYAQALGAAAAAGIETRLAELNLAAAIARTYVALAAEFDQADISQDLLRQKQEIQALSARLVGAGLVTDVENQQSLAAIAAARAELSANNERIAVLKQELAVLAGHDPAFGDTLTRPALALAAAPGLPDNLPADLIGRRPDIVASRWRVEAAGHGIDVARARFYPNVDLRAFLSLSAFGLDKFVQAGSSGYGAGPAVSLPIFDAGRLRAGLGAARADLDGAVAAYNASLLNALGEVAGQLTAWRAAAEQSAHQHDAVAHASEAYRLALMRYREGLANYLTVLSAEGDLIALRRQETQSLNRQYGVSIALTQALGGGMRLETPAAP